MAWKKPDPVTTDLHEQFATIYPAEKKKMFGYQVFYVNGNMFTGVFEDGIFLRLSPEDKAEVLADCEEVTLFTPRGREMKEYVVFGKGLLDRADFVSAWMARSFGYVSTLPPKEKKPNSKK